MASRFFVGNGTNWSSTSSWSTTSGGASGAAVPTSADDVILDSHSPGNLVIDSAVAACLTFDATGFTHAVTQNTGVTIQVWGTKFTLVPGMTWTTSSPGASGLAVKSTSGITAITTAGFAMPGLTMDGLGGTAQIQDGYATTASWTVVNGTLDTNGTTCSLNTMNFGTGIKTLTLGASSLTVAGNWSNTTSNTTFNCGTSTITLTGAGTFSGNGLTFYNVLLTSGGTVSMTGANTFNNLTRDSGANEAGMALAQGITVNGILTLNATTGATAGNHMTIGPTIVSDGPSQVTITVNGSYSFNNVNFNYVNAAGSAPLPWTGTGMGDGSGNSNITFDAPRDLYAVGLGSANFNFNTLAKWALSSGGSSASTCPRPQDNCHIDANCGTTAGIGINTSLRFLGRNVDFTGMPFASSSNFGYGSFNPFITGSLTWAPGMTVTATGTQSLGFCFDSRDVTLTNNGVVYPHFSNMRCGGTGSMTITDNLNMDPGNGWTHDDGTLTFQGANNTFGFFQSSNSNIRTVNLGANTFNVAGTGTLWLFTTITNLTLNASQATINITDTSASTKTITGPGQVYGDWNLAASAGNIIFNNSFTVRNFTVAPGCNWQMLAGGTLAIIGGTFLCRGSSANPITITSTSAGTSGRITYGGIVDGDYLSIQDSQIVGSKLFYAGQNSTNVSGNTGWIFGGIANGDVTMPILFNSKKPQLAPMDFEVPYSTRASAIQYMSFGASLQPSGNMNKTAIKPQSANLKFNQPLTPAFIQTANANNNGATSSVSVTMGQNVTKGNLIVVAVGTQADSDGPILSVTDTLGNTYTKAISFHNHNGATAANDIWYTISQASGPNTVTANSAFTSNIAIVAQEFSGIAQTNSVDVATGQYASNTVVQTASASTSVAGELLFAAVTIRSNSLNTISPNLGASNLDSNLSAISNELAAESKITVAPGFYRGDFSVTTESGIDYTALVVTFKAATPTVFTKTAKKNLTAGLSFTGSMQKTLGRSLTASLSFTGSSKRLLKRSLTASLSFTGSMGKLLKRGLTAAIGFIGSWTHGEPTRAVGEVEIITVLLEDNTVPVTLSNDVTTLLMDTDRSDEQIPR